MKKNDISKVITELKAVNDELENRQGQNIPVLPNEVYHIDGIAKADGIGNGKPYGVFTTKEGTPISFTQLTRTGCIEGLTFKSAKMLERVDEILALSTTEDIAITLQCVAVKKIESSSRPGTNNTYTKWTKA